jgi:hypothetical protein
MARKVVYSRLAFHLLACPVRARRRFRSKYAHDHRRLASEVKEDGMKVWRCSVLGFEALSWEETLTNGLLRRVNITSDT